MENKEKNIIKEKFIAAEIVVIAFDSEDIITSSDPEDFSDKDVTLPRL